jgi:hypothetical protein
MQFLKQKSDGFIVPFNPLVDLAKFDVIEVPAGEAPPHASEYVNPDDTPDEVIVGEVSITEVAGRVKRTPKSLPAEAEMVVG